jgi:hypothetical protein
LATTSYEPSAPGAGTPDVKERFNR